MNEPRVRDESLDALRAALTVLVIFHHTAITYGGSGDWYYKEITQGGVSSSLLSLFTAINQSYFMGLFFLIAGYLTPGAYARRGAGGFLRERALRLGVPLLIYGFVVGPATIALAQTAKGKEFVATLLRLWGEGRFEIGPPWFCWALLIFAILYVAVRAVRPKPPLPPFPSDRTLLVAALAVGAVSFAVRLVYPTGKSLLALQLGYFPGYVVLFVAGCAASGWPSLDAAPGATRRLWRRVAWITLPVLPLASILLQRLGATGLNFAGGFNPAALVYAFWEPFLAWGVILVLLHQFRMRFSTMGSFGRAFARRAYAIYLIHPPFVVGVALAWRTIEAPAMIKAPVTGSVAAVLCWLAAGLLLRIPGASRVV